MSEEGDILGDPVRAAGPGWETGAAFLLELFPPLGGWAEKEPPGAESS